MLVPSNYMRTSLQQLYHNPGQYTGRDICITGNLDSDYDWVDAEIPAFYEHSIHSARKISKNNLKVSINPVYAIALQKLKLPKECTIYGSCILRQASGTVGSMIWIRIDRVEALDGSSVSIVFNVQTTTTKRPIDPN